MNNTPNKKVEDCKHEHFYNVGVTCRDCGVFMNVQTAYPPEKLVLGLRDNLDSVLWKILPTLEFEPPEKIKRIVDAFFAASEKLGDVLDILESE